MDRSDRWTSIDCDASSFNDGKRHRHYCRADREQPLSYPVAVASVTWNAGTDKLAFHDADTDMDFLARILADMSDTRT